MRVIFQISVIVAALTVLTGCGQRGPLYIPTVPPLPAKPMEELPSDVTPSAETAETPAKNQVVN